MMDVVIVSVADIKEVFYVSPNLISLNVGDYVIFESELGLLVGSVIKASYKEKRNNLVLPLYNVLRIVNDKDIKIINKNKEIMKKSLKDAKKISSEYGLDMKFIDSYLTFDNKLLIFSFVSDERIDFRDLVKKLAQKYKKRIELRQIGVRDKAKKIGGLKCSEPIEEEWLEYSGSKVYRNDSLIISGWKNVDSIELGPDKSKYTLFGIRIGMKAEEVKKQMSSKTLFLEEDNNYVYMIKKNSKNPNISSEDIIVNVRMQKNRVTSVFYGYVGN